ncbi:MAG: hypothetical protein ACI8RD_012882 [Bacillariaceae sp.]|jgi:hypothetical protein
MVQLDRRDRPWFESYCSLILYFLLKLVLLLSSFKVFHFFSFFLTKLASRFTS